MTLQMRSTIFGWRLSRLFVVSPHRFRAAVLAAMLARPDEPLVGRPLSFWACG